MPHKGKKGMDYKSTPGHPKDGKGGIHKDGKGGLHQIAPVAPAGPSLRGPGTRFSSLNPKASAAVPNQVNDKISARRQKIQELIKRNRPTV